MTALTSLTWFDHLDPTRTQLVDCTICDATGTTSCDTRNGTPWYHTGRRWTIGLTHPGNGWGSEIPATPANGCHPTVETRHQPHDDGHIVYRGACLGCGWADTTRTDENPAVEDAHDHACPGWRNLPVVHRPRVDLDSDRKAANRWIDDCRTAYRLAGLDHHLLGTGWPLRTWRQPQGTRSHWSHTIGGYDICGGITAPVDSPPVIDQPTLF